LFLLLCEVAEVAQLEQEPLLIQHQLKFLRWFSLGLLGSNELFRFMQRLVEKAKIDSLLSPSHHRPRSCREIVLFTLNSSTLLVSFVMLEYANPCHSITFQLKLLGCGFTSQKGYEATASERARRKSSSSTSRHNSKLLLICLQRHPLFKYSLFPKEVKRIHNSQDQ
jgi:hypothetical protein